MIVGWDGMGFDKPLILGWVGWDMLRFGCSVLIPGTGGGI